MLKQLEIEAWNKRPLESSCFVHFKTLFTHLLHAIPKQKGINLHESYLCLGRKQDECHPHETQQLFLDLLREDLNVCMSSEFIASIISGISSSNSRMQAIIMVRNERVESCSNCLTFREHQISQMALSFP